MANVDIEVTLQNGTEQFGARQFRPGDVVQGSVTLYPDDDVKCDHLYVRLGWHTEGRGTRYREQANELDIYQGQLRNGMPQAFEFSFTLPEEPWSYEGHYVSVVWAVTVQVDVPWAKDPKYEEAFLLRP
jgi:hypothetical protein